MVRTSTPSPISPTSGSAGTVSDETGALASGVLAVPPVAAGTSAVVPMPAIPREGEGELWLTVRAALAA